MPRLRRWFGLAAFALILAACSQAPAAAPTVEPTALEPVAPTATVQTVAAKDTCVECHTDKEQLIQTAKPEEVKPKESEGVG